MHVSRATFFRRFIVNVASRGEPQHNMKQNDALPDSGASVCVFRDKYLCKECIPTTTASIRGVSGTTIAPSCECKLHATANGEMLPPVRVLVWEHAPANLISLKALTQYGWSARYGEGDGDYLMSPSGTRHYMHQRGDGLSYLPVSGVPMRAIELPAAEIAASILDYDRAVDDSGATRRITRSERLKRLLIMELHVRLGHCSFAVLRTMVNAGLIHGVTAKDLPAQNPLCTGCLHTTKFRIPHNIKTHVGREARRFHTVVSDVWGPLLFRGRKTWFILMICIATGLSRMTHVTGKGTRRGVHSVDIWLSLQEQTKSAQVCVQHLPAKHSLASTVAI